MPLASRGALSMLGMFLLAGALGSVSYTHLDVYKRQAELPPDFQIRGGIARVHGYGQKHHLLWLFPAAGDGRGFCLPGPYQGTDPSRL